MVTVEIKVEIIDGTLADGRKLRLVDLDYKVAGYTSETIVDYGGGQTGNTNSGHNTEQSKRDYDLNECKTRLDVLHAGAFNMRFTLRRPNRSTTTDTNGGTCLELMM